MHLPAAAGLAGEALASAGYLAAAYQDVSSRSVDDRAWIAVAAGAALAAASAPWPYPLWTAAKLAAMLALAVAWRRMGLIAQADVPALALVAGDLDPLSPVPELAISLLAAAAIAAAEGGLRLRRAMPLAEAASQLKWIPRRILRRDGSVVEELRGTPEEAWEALERHRGEDLLVEATYGLPLAAALGAGYVAASILAALGLLRPP